MIRFDPTDRDRQEPHRQRSNNRAVAHLGSVIAVEMADGSAGLALTVSGAIIKCFTRATALHLADALVDAVEHIDQIEAGRHEPAALTNTTHVKEKI